MQVKDKTIIVTGAGGGIGQGLCQRFHLEKAKAIVVTDIDVEAAQQVAKEVEGIAMKCDVSSEEEINHVVEQTQKQVGAIDLFCSNAGIMVGDGPEQMCWYASNQQWHNAWQVNVMSHVFAARAVLPDMIERGGGYFLITSSAAGLLSRIGDTPYSTTKHAAIGFAEALAIAHGDQGIKVSVLCPQGVATALTKNRENAVHAVDGVLQPSDVAESVIQGLERESFLILPHPEVLTYMQRKASDYDRWINGMRRLRNRYL